MSWCQCQLYNYIYIYIIRQFDWLTKNDCQLYNTISHDFGQVFVSSPGPWSSPCRCSVPLPGSILGSSGPARPVRPDAPAPFLGWNDVKRCDKKAGRPWFYVFFNGCSMIWYNIMIFPRKIGGWRSMSETFLHVASVPRRASTWMVCYLI